MHSVKSVRTPSFSGPNRGKYGTEKFPIRTLFTQCCFKIFVKKRQIKILTCILSLLSARFKSNLSFMYIFLCKSDVNIKQIWSFHQIFSNLKVNSKATTIKWRKIAQNEVESSFLSKEIFCFRVLLQILPCLVGQNFWGKRGKLRIRSSLSI